jgi:hypothetical protein
VIAVPPCNSIVERTGTVSENVRPTLHLLHLLHLLHAAGRAPPFPAVGASAT